LELGPGRTLSGLTRQIDRSAATYAAGSPAGLDAFAADVDDMTPLATPREALFLKTHHDRQ
jgi:hypothetical protein